MTQLFAGSCWAILELIATKHHQCIGYHQCTLGSAAVHFEFIEHFPGVPTNIRAKHDCIGDGTL